MNKVLWLGVMLLTSISGWSQETENIDKIVGWVGNEIVLKSEIEIQAIQRNEGKAATDESRCISIEESLFQKLLLHQAKIDSLVYSDDEVQADIDQRLEYFISILGSEKAFEEYYGKSIAEWREEFVDPIREQKMSEQMQSQILRNVKVTPGEVQEYFNRIDEDSLPLINASLEFSQIQIKPELSQENKEATIAFLDSIRQIVVNRPDAMNIQAAKWSEDPGSKYNGGCYPMQAKGAFVPEYESAVYNTPIGGVSPVFKSTFGYHFVLVKDVRGDNYESCHILMSAKPKNDDLKSAENKAQLVSEEIALDSLSYGEAATKYSMDESTSNQGGRMISKYSGSPKHEIRELEQSVFFVLDQLEPGEVSEPVLIMDPLTKTGTWYIYRLDKRNDAHVANLKDDFEIFNAQTSTIKRKEAMDDWMRWKIAETYIRIDEDFHNCSFEYDWLKTNK